MTRHRKTDAHIATLRISIPISMMHLSTVTEAAAAINGLQAHLPPGSTVEVLNSRFGRVDAPVVVPPPKQMDIEYALRSLTEATVLAVRGSYDAPGFESNVQAEMRAITAGAVDPLDPPESLRRVPRRDPYNGATPMDPSGDGSYRGPDGAR